MAPQQTPSQKSRVGPADVSLDRDIALRLDLDVRLDVSINDDRRLDPVSSLNGTGKSHVFGDRRRIGRRLASLSGLVTDIIQ